VGRLHGRFTPAVLASTAAVTALLVLAGCAAAEPGYGEVAHSAGAAQSEAAPAPRVVTPAPAPAPASLPPVPVVPAGVPAIRQAAAPVRLQIPSKTIRMPVVPVGVLPDGGMQLPDHQTVAGWYRWGATPGDGAGSTLIAAHVDTLKYGIGPFAQLRYLAPGALIRVWTSDGRTHDYAVERVEYVRQQTLPLRQIFGRDGPARLTLVTCGGSYDSATHRYSDNVLVFARPSTA
jgi:Sortase domain